MPAVSDPNVFISFSGPRSKAIAMKLAEVLPLVVGAARPWTSEGIAKETSWPTEIQKALRSVKAGIIVITPENVNERWIQYEAGALSNGIEDSPRRVFPYVYVLGKGKIGSPLNLFQATDADEKDTLEMVKSIRDVLMPDLPDTALEFSFKHAYAQLAAKFEEIKQEEDKEAKKGPSVEDMFNEILTLVRGLGAERHPLFTSPFQGSHAALQKYGRMKSFVQAVLSTRGLPTRVRGPRVDSKGVTSFRLEVTRDQLGEDSEAALAKFMYDMRAGEVRFQYLDGEAFVDEKGSVSFTQVVC